MATATTRSALHRFAFGRLDRSVHVAPLSRTELVGRILLAAIFVLSGIMKLADFEGSLGHMMAQGIPYASALLVIAAIVEIAGGLSIITGFLTRLGAFALFLYLIPVTLLFHDFWNLAGQERIAQSAQFMKNLAIMGGLLVLMAHGAARHAVDRRIDRTRAD
jgi:putative oxidoreductase